ncbi:hypothetical protein MTR67_044588 [Solanum verrucosum]|uniref:Response regulatory domain-containing protein n=1 Tax=Solanum verrucosum TaxID=315347 RepID=A0AAF0UQT2_SOLVR|nr:hypothetical protein MTR67_044588 [Solanum verrucosum]
MVMLSKGELFFDVIIISVHSLNLNSFKLLAQAVTLDIISLFVCDEYNELLAKKALKEGACIFLQRPLNEKIVKYLWQFALRRKIEREKARKGSEDGVKMIVNDVDTNNIDVDNEELSKETNDVPNPEEHSNNIHEVEDNIISNGKYKRRRKNNREDIKEDKVIKQKDSVKWIADLHAKFMKSLKQLGEGRNATSDELGKINANFQQHFAEPNMSYPSNIIAKTYKSDIEGCDSNEKEDCDAYSNFHNMGYFFRNLGPPGANLPNSYDSEFDQVYSDD